MRQQNHTEVLVVGAGPVGMFAALQLAENGVRVRVIDQESRTAARSYACALHPHTLKLLDEPDLLNSSLKLGSIIDTVGFYDRRGRRAELRLSELGLEFPSLVVLPQSALESLIEERLNDLEHVQIDWNSRLSELKQNGTAVTATIDHLAETSKGYAVARLETAVDKTIEVSADFVVGADGRNSQVRQCLGLEYESVGDPELFVVYEFKGASRSGGEMRIVLDGNTANVLWPLSEDNYRWSFQITPADAPGDFPKKERETFTVEEAPAENDSRHQLQRLIKERAPWFECEVKEVEWSTDIQFERRLARQFGQNRCWLAGDAAHQTGPIGMQSANAGLHEAADLATRLEKIIHGRATTDLLQEYNADRQSEWQRLLGLSGVPKATNLANPWISEHASRIAACLPASGNDLRLLLRALGFDLA